MLVLFSYETYNSQSGSLENYKLYNDVSVLVKDLDNTKPFIVKVYEGNGLFEIGRWTNKNYQWLKELEKYNVPTFRYIEYFCSDSLKVRQEFCRLYHVPFEHVFGDGDHLQALMHKLIKIK